MGQQIVVEPSPVSPIVGSSAIMRALRAAVDLAARSDAPVLVRGPCGSGRSLVARALHDRSSRRARPFVLRWAGTAAPTDGAADHADACACMVSRDANAPGGSLVLDDVGDLGADRQAQLLWGLEAHEHAVSSSDTAPRLIAVTRHDLAERAGSGLFRDDLRLRLGVIAIDVPALDARVSDIPELIDHLARRRGGGAPSVRFSRAALARLAQARWPGHVRELAGFVERASLAAARGTVLDERATLALLGPDALDTAGELDLDALLDATERRHIADALARSGGVVAEAARLLRLRRTTLIDRMRKHALGRAVPGERAGPAIEAGSEEGVPGPDAGKRGVAERAPRTRVEARSRMGQIG